MASSLLVIDHREGKLKELFSQSPQYELGVVFENLDEGDILIRMNNSNAIIFERKTVNDLCASIIDGRYRTQKSKMMAHYDCKNIYYIIEGIVNLDDKIESGLFKIDKKALHGAIINTVMRDKISVFFTKDIHETMFLIKEIYTRVKKDPYLYCYKNKDDSVRDIHSESLCTTASIPPLITVTHSKKCPTMTKMDCFRLQLCQIPGVSEKTATVIAAHFGTLSSFVNELAKIDETEKLNVLKNLSTTNSKGKTRKISTSTATNIIQFML